MTPVAASVLAVVFALAVACMFVDPVRLFMVLTVAALLCVVVALAAGVAVASRLDR